MFACAPTASDAFDAWLQLVVKPTLGLQPDLHGSLLVVRAHEHPAGSSPPHRSSCRPHGEQCEVPAERGPQRRRTAGDRRSSPDHTFTRQVPQSPSPAQSPVAYGMSKRLVRSSYSRTPSCRKIPLKAQEERGGEREEGKERQQDKGGKPSVRPRPATVPKRHTARASPSGSPQVGAGWSLHRGPIAVRKLVVDGDHGALDKAVHDQRQLLRPRVDAHDGVDEEVIVPPLRADVAAGPIRDGRDHVSHFQIHSLGGSISFQTANEHKSL
eukprot:scaffold1220_cov259-Pinguiococcus_pyrenoidosus.AAC.105